MSPWIQLAAVPAASFAVALLIAGCSTQADTAAPTPQFAADASATPGMPGMGSMPSGSAMPGMSPSPSGATTVPAEPVAGDAVAIDNFAFVPSVLTVKVGDTVTWTNKDEDPHNVVAGSGEFRSQAMTSGGTYSFTFGKAGTFDYICSIHPFMTGKVVVTA